MPSAAPGTWLLAACYLLPATCCCICCCPLPAGHCLLCAAARCVPCAAAERPGEDPGRDAAQDALRMEEEDRGHARCERKKRISFRAIWGTTKTHHFTKTGSGQTQGKHSKRGAFFAGALRAGMLLRGSGWNAHGGDDGDDAAELTEEERLALEAELRAAEEEERRRQAEEEMARRCGQRHTQTRRDRQIDRQTDRQTDRDTEREPRSTPRAFLLACFAKTGLGQDVNQKLQCITSSSTKTRAVCVCCPFAQVGGEGAGAEGEKTSSFASFDAKKSDHFTKTGSGHT